MLPHQRWLDYHWHQADSALCRGVSCVCVCLCRWGKGMRGRSGHSHLFPEFSSDVAKPLGAVKAHGLQTSVPQHFNHLSIFWKTQESRGWLIQGNKQTFLLSRFWQQMFQFYQQYRRIEKHHVEVLLLNPTGWSILELMSNLCKKSLEKKIP